LNFPYERQLVQAHFGQAAVQFPHFGAEEVANVLRCLVAQPAAPDLVPLFVIEIGEIGGEAMQEVAFGKYDINGKNAAKAGGQFINAIPDDFDMPLNFLVVGSKQIGQTDRHNGAVKGLAATVLAQQRQKSQPFRAIVLLGGVASRCIQQDGFVGKPPVAVACAPETANIDIVVVSIREVEPRVTKQRGFTRGCRADDHKPGQSVQRGVTPVL